MSKYDRKTLVEHIKVTSDGLRGTLSAELEQPTEAFSTLSARLLFFHGVYQQENRDRRRRSDAATDEREYDFMLRLKAAAGKLTAAQWVTILDLADGFGTGAVQLTSRQGVQIAGIRKAELSEVLRQVDRAGLTTLGSGGDLNCNVMCCPPTLLNRAAAEEMDGLADALSRALLPAEDGYRATWRLDDTQSDAQSDARHELGGNGSRRRYDFPYGPSYLPHKFKIGLACENDNCTDVLVQDIGLVAVLESERIVGYHVLIGGGLGHVPSSTTSFPRLATPLAFVAPRDVPRLVFAIVKMYRDLGDRSCRYRGRLKYLVHDRGIQRIRRHLEDDLGEWLPWPRPFEITGCDDHRGWQQHYDGRWSLGLQVFDGLVEDGAGARLKSALRALLEMPDTSLRVLPRRRLLWSGAAEVTLAAVDAVLAAHGVLPLDDVAPLRRCSDACPGLPFCGHAITESHRLLPKVLEELETVLERLELADEPICLRLAGCPAGCTRSYLAEIAVVGRSLAASTLEGKYAIYVGGDRFGRRLATLYDDLVDQADIVPTLIPLLVYYRRCRIASESFGDFCHREGVNALHAFASAYPCGGKSVHTASGA
ncbi:MAG: NADPH-dependent assimilatory sulfite reductase hemoprotein subunit [Pirellulales bacterium]